MECAGKRSATALWLRRWGEHQAVNDCPEEPKRGRRSALPPHAIAAPFRTGHSVLGRPCVTCIFQTDGSILRPVDFVRLREVLRYWDRWGADFV